MSDAPRPKYQRSAKNYLLDKQFQLKYTGFLVAIALALSIGLGVLLWITSSEVLTQSRATVAQAQQTLAQSQETVRLGQETAKQGQDVIDESRKVSQVVSMQIEGCYGDNPILQKTFKQSTEEDDAKRNKQQAQLEKDAADFTKRAGDLEGRAKAVKEQSEAIESGQKKMFIGLVAALTVMVLAIGIAGIIFTHKIAGPIYKMKRLMRQVGEGKLVLREKLRKGDELKHFFDTFEQMVENMRENQRGEIARVDRIIEELSKDHEAGLESLSKLRHDMQEHIEP